MTQVEGDDLIGSESNHQKLKRKKADKKALLNTLFVVKQR